MSFLVLLNVITTQDGLSQNVGINATGAAPSAWAMLDISHGTKGLLIPRISLSAINNASPIGSGMPISMLVYNTATAGTAPNSVFPGYYYWDGSEWIALAGDGGKNWSLLGNSGTVDGTNFIGTTDNVPLNFRINNLSAGRIDNSSKNVSYGYQAGTITGSGNTAIGHQVLTLNTFGFFNTGCGLQALTTNTTGNYNSAFGAYALYNNTSGTDNTAVGYGALARNTTGQYNSAIGENALYYNSGSYNTAAGYNALGNNYAGTFNTAIGYSALAAASNGSNNIGVGNNAQVPAAAGNNQIRMGNTSITYAGVQVAWSITSDKRWKSEIKTSNLGLNFIRALNPVYYVRENDASKKTEYGFIAQEVEETLKTFGAINNGIIAKDDEGLLSMRYNDLIAPMVKAIQEQQEMIEILKVQNKELELRLKALEHK
ncbi:MAG: tail fiber domain-containing protein [Bacteroidota bacterium]